MRAGSTLKALFRLGKPRLVPHQAKQEPLALNKSLKEECKAKESSADEKPYGESPKRIRHISGDGGEALCLHRSHSGQYVDCGPHQDDHGQKERQKREISKQPGLGAALVPEVL
jgi:hypothetical protein